MKTHVVAAVVMVSALAAGPAGAQQRVAPSRGPERAGTQIEVFLSFGDPQSARASVVLDALMERRPEAFQVVFRHLAPDAKAPAVLAHRAALAAAAQSRFWEMAQLLFANPDRHAREDVIGMARQLRLDLARFTADLDAPGAEAVLGADYARARERGFTAAPGYIINGKALSGIRTLDELEALAVR